MKTRRNPKLLALLGLATVQAVFLCFADGAAPVAATNAPAAEAQIPQSQFDDSLPNGRDPFFPRSQSRAASAGSTNTSRVASSSLVYRGVSGPPERRLAVINNASFSAGEEKEIVIAGSRIKVRCEEIRDDLVVVSVGSPPQRIELPLKKRF